MSLDTLPSETQLDSIAARRAIEALRAGVPNRDAVQALPGQQPQVETRFRRLLSDLDADADAREASKGVAGLLIAGDFGSGKSHLLEYLEHLALDEQVVTSRVVISKETPLYEPARVLRAAIESMQAPGRIGWALAELVGSLNTDSPEYAALLHWAGRPDVGLSSRFAASLLVYQQTRDPEIRDRIVSQWAGDPLNVSQMRSWLRDLGEARTYRLEGVPQRALALQRARFLARLAQAAGYAGWLILLDEVELIGRYSFKQRARSYAELARWLGKLKGASLPGVAAVAAITTDFDAAILQGRRDREAVPAKLRASGGPQDAELADTAERGMDVIEREAVRLRGPDRAMIERTRQAVRALHARAYQWEPPDMGAGEQLSTTRMRQYVRRWINEWDLKRLDPDYVPQTVIGELHQDYSEQLDLERSIPDGAEPELDADAAG